LRLVKLTDRGGNAVYVNPAQVLTVEPYPIYRADVHVGTGAKLSFALVGSHCTTDGTTDVEAYKEIVTECPREVAGLFLEPCGP
jgi:hypothetical protein